MSGLSLSLSIATQALLANQAATSATTNNIANVNTPGYARERVVLSEAQPVQQGDLVFGTGVALQGFESVRDSLLELQINDEAQQQSGAQAQLQALQQVESYFSSSSQGIGADLTAFFNSLDSLSADPTSVPLREAVLTQANNLTTSFHQAAGNLSGVASSLDQTIVQTVSQINDLSAQIASLNGQVSQMQKLGQSPGVLEDQRLGLIKQLSQLTDVAVTHTEQGDTLSTANGIPLVVGNKSFGLDTVLDASGVHHVQAQGRDVTDLLHGGSLGGQISVRDVFVNNTLAQVNDLATQLADAFNSAHKAGFDLSGSPGQDFFAFQSGTGAAAGLMVALGDPAKIAAASDTSSGSNGNIGGLVAVRDKKISSGQTATEAYSNLVFQIGTASAQAKTAADAGSIALQQLNDQRAAVSGVSLDEETANLMRYQRAYQAAARVISTIDQLTQTVLTMGAGQ